MTKILYQNKWVSLMMNEDPPFVFSTESRCEGKIVAVLPFRDEGIRREYLIRRELNPAWGNHYIRASITGGVDTGKPSDTAIHELKEEAGYDVYSFELYSLGQCRGVKSCDTTYYLYAADLSFRVAGKASGDGTKLEETAWCEWTGDLFEAEDPLVGMMYMRMGLLGV